jgi:uncharacterized protein (UPF0332 family)
MFLTTSDLQFGFKAGVGCTDALYCLKSVVNHYIDAGCTVTMSALDMSKAFDKISHSCLYLKLLHRSVPKCFIDILLCWYSKCQASVRWGSAMSQVFKVSAGVRQGGILSPFLFAIYIEDMVHELKQSKLGCCINKQYLGIFLYADDILLISQSVTCMQKMLNLCFDIATQLDMKFNFKKSVVMRIGKRF